MKRLLNKASALALAVLLLVSLTVPAAWADDDTTVTISSAEELIQFSKNCSLDTWSQGKTVRLTANIDLSGQTFTPIPTFGGTFLGEGYTISGLRVTTSGSHMGLFRYLQAGAVVRDLHVSGSVVPGGSQSTVGGIVGVNAGTVLNCTFLGGVKGDASVGGIAGQNDATGEITGCSVSGAVFGKSRTGGIVGRNLGLVMKCQNSASINTTGPDNTVNLEDLASLGSLESLTTSGDETDTLRTNHTDSGGVAGWSGGVIQSCTNSGTIGYPHVGYNIGGIAGRQSGYLAGCTNSGAVYGRKDVGGIVGQAEPDVIINASGDSLGQLRQELDTLNTLVNRALDHTDASRADISAQLTAIGSTTDDAIDSSKTLLDDIADFADGNIDTINSLSVTITAALDKLDPALEDLSAVADRIGDIADALEDALDTIEDATDTAAATLQQTRDAIADLKTAGTNMGLALEDTKTALTALQEAVTIKEGQEDAVNAALDDLFGTPPSDEDPDGKNGALYDLVDSLNELGEAMSNMTLFTDLIPSIRAFGTALTAVNSDLLIILQNIDIHREKLNEAYDAMMGTDGNPGALAHLEDSLKNLSDAADDLDKALASGQTLTEELGTAADQLQDVAQLTASMSRKLKDAFEEMRDAVELLTKDGPFTFTPLGQEVRDAGDSLYGSLSQLSDQLSSLQSTVDDAGDTLSSDLRAISRQMNRVFNLIIDILSDVQGSTSTDLSDYVEDTSDEDIAATRQGKVTDCRNTGAINGDRSVGGVIGAMSVEYDLDPEDEGDRFTLGSTYETKAILQNSVNRGSVTAKKDCAGGLVGSMELGTTIDCQNYGAVTSTNGSYVGGVAGLSQSTVRSSYAKCVLSGTDNVGGIVGWGTRILDCCAIATIDGGTECVGAIAGDADLSGGTVTNNRFVDTGTAGIDGVSYAGVAEPVAFDVLRQEGSLPTEFLSFTLTLLADGKQTASIPFFYGADLSLVELPEVPEKEGYFGSWPDFDTSGLRSDITLEAVYTPWITLVASGALSDKLPLAMAEGQFTDSAVLHVTDSASAPPAAEDEKHLTDVWDLSLEGTDLTDGDTVPIRLLNRGGGKAQLWQLTDGQWQPVDAEVNGHYLIASMNGTSGTFCVRSVPSSGFPVWVLLAAAGAAAVLLTALVLRRVRGKKAARKAAGQSEQPQSVP